MDVESNFTECVKLYDASVSCFLEPKRRELVKIPVTSPSQVSNDSAIGTTTPLVIKTAFEPFKLPKLDDRCDIKAVIDADEGVVFTDCVVGESVRNLVKENFFHNNDVDFEYLTFCIEELEDREWLERSLWTPSRVFQIGEDNNISCGHNIDTGCSSDCYEKSNTTLLLCENADFANSRISGDSIELLIVFFNVKVLRKPGSCTTTSESETDVTLLELETLSLEVDRLWRKIITSTNKMLSFVYVYGEETLRRVQAMLDKQKCLYTTTPMFDSIQEFILYLHKYLFPSTTIVS